MKSIFRRRALAVLVGFVVVVSALGVAWARRLPTAVVSERTITVAQDAERVFNTIVDVAGYPRWMPGIGAIEAQPAEGGRPTFVERRSDHTMVLRVERAERPREVVIQMNDAGGDYRAEWTYQISPGSEGNTTVLVREKAELPGLVFRMAYHLGGADANVRQVAEALKSGVALAGP